MREREREPGDNGEEAERRRQREEGGALMNNPSANIKGIKQHLDNVQKKLNMLVELCKGWYKQISNIKGQKSKNLIIPVFKPLSRSHTIGGTLCTP